MGKKLVKAYRGPNPIAVGNPLESWDPRSDVPRPRD